MNAYGLPNVVKNARLPILVWEAYWLLLALSLAFSPHLMSTLSKRSTGRRPPRPIALDALSSKHTLGSPTRRTNGTPTVSTTASYTKRTQQVWSGDWWSGEVSHHRVWGCERTCSTCAENKCHCRVMNEVVIHNVKDLR